MRGLLGFCLISLAVAACAAATPPKVGERTALVLRGDNRPTLRVSQVATPEPAPEPARKLTLPTAPEPVVMAQPAAAVPAPVVLALPAPPAPTPRLQEAPPAPPPTSRVMAVADFASEGGDQPQAENAYRAQAAETPDLSLAYFTAQAEPRPTSDDLADPLTRLLGEQPDEYLRPIGALQADITFKPGPLPEKYDRMAAEKFARAGEVVASFGSDRAWPPFTYAYVAPALCHRPLYFEEPNVERYGYQLGCVQSVVSGAHFFATVPFVPYKMVINHPHDCIYTLGQYRPGDYTPFQRTRFVWDTKAAVAQVGVVVGLVFLIP